MKQLVRSVLGRLGYRIQGTRYIPKQLLEPSCLRVLDLADIISRRMVDRGQALTFIQIGAFDGITADPLHRYIGRYGWRGIMVEPQPRAVRELRELYRDNQHVVIMEGAVDRHRGKRILFTVDSVTAPTWAAGMASFERGHVEKHEYLIPGLSQMIQEIIVDCILFEDVLEQLNNEDIDVLQIDAEGADAYLLCLFPFERVKPAIIHWEIKNLSVAEREECLDRLFGLGYRFAASGGEDMIAVLADS